MTHPEMAADRESTQQLRVFFITEDDPIYVYEFFDTFFEEAPWEWLEVCGITIGRAFHEPLHKTAARMFRFYGALGFIRQGVKFATTRLRRRSIRRLARDHGIQEIGTRSVNDREYVQRLRAMDVDVIVSVAAPEIFRRDLLESARLSCINIHSGKLPRYRGMMPTFWQLLNGEDTVTVTVHEMVAKLDAGSVLGTVEYPIRDRDSLDRVITATKREGARLMIDVLDDFRTGSVDRSPLDMERASYYSFPEPTDVRNFRRRGHRLL